MDEEGGMKDMKIVIVGPGAIGCAIAASVAQGDSEVFILGRERHKEYFKKNPVIYKSYAVDFSSKVEAITMDDLKNGNINEKTVKNKILLLKLIKFQVNPNKNLFPRCTCFRYFFATSKLFKACLRDVIPKSRIW